MPFIELNDLDINKDYTTREIDLITFKSILAKIQTFSNIMKNNLTYLSQHSVGEATVTASTTAPANPKIGDVWLDIN